MFQIWRYLRWQETVHQTQAIQRMLTTALLQQMQITAKIHQTQRIQARIQARTHLTAQIHQIQRTIATAQMRVTVANNF